MRSESLAETGTQVLQVVNTPVRGQIGVFKQGLLLKGFETKEDGYGNVQHLPVYETGYLKGAVFEIHAAENITGRDGTSWYKQGDLAATVTTTDCEKNLSELLPLGKYEVYEIKSPQGYALDNTHHIVELTFSDDQTPVVERDITSLNAYLPTEITLTKLVQALETVQDDQRQIRQRMVEKPGEGFVFGLYNAKAISYPGGVLPADTLIASAVTDAEGQLTLNSHFPHGEYYLKELSGPAGWTLTQEAIFISLLPEKAGEDKVIRAALDEPVLNKLVCASVNLKKTNLGQKLALPGCWLEVVNKNGEAVYSGRTDEHGEIAHIPLVPGSYFVREISAPNGYELSQETLAFRVLEDGSVTGDTCLTDDVARFSVRKADENHRPLAGATFGLFNAEGQRIRVAVSDDNGIARFSHVPFGSFTIRKVEAPKGYLLSQDTVELTMDETWKNTGKPIATVTNHLKKILCLKVDTSGKPLPGVTFHLINAATGEIAETAVSDKDGAFVFTQFDFGDWIVREAAAPEGYCKMKDIAFHVGKDWSVPEPIMCINIPKHFEFVKTDASGIPLAGVKFRLENAQGKALETYTSGKDGMVRIKGLSPGTYYVKEIETLEGYTLSGHVMKAVIDEKYVIPEKTRRVVNYTIIQTGVGIAVTGAM